MLLSQIRVSNYAAIVLSIMPILGLYNFVGPFTIVHIFILLTLFLIIISYKEITYKNPLIYLYISHFVCCIIVFFLRSNELNSEKIIVSTFFTLFNVIIIVQLYMIANKKIFIKSSLIVGIVSTLFLFLQYFMMVSGINPPDGRLPFLDLNEHQGWAPIDINNIYQRRLHSIFPEPSYFAIYILPLLAYCLLNKRWFLSILFFISLIISTSSLGIILGSSVLIIVLIYTFRNNRGTILTILVISAFGIMATKNNHITELLGYNINKISNLGTNSDIRLIGYIDYFKLMPTELKIFGIGYNQVPFYFSEFGLKNYSNAFVLTLLQFGIIGFLFFIGFIIYLLTQLKAFDKIYILIFVVICSVDAFLYNFYFYYILTFIFLSIKRDGEHFEKSNDPCLHDSKSGR
ncbi:hypothetical protein [Bhargavaea beijingensis]|uniref:hypothetical protein n=1 Tax=Bhargavaea beijingensis TaxID=426756 RepID=UPI0022245C8D|nr:hypothetical protein [Bhargavaea beijingensis]MCW1929094.1 hypothetical protein [Bhargavaea beijingensis]